MEANDACSNVMRIPTSGIRVKMGPDWVSGEKDGNWLGTITSVSCNRALVTWDIDGSRHWHRAGYYGKYEWCIVEEEKAILLLM